MPLSASLSKSFGKCPTFAVRTVVFRNRSSVASAEFRSRGFFQVAATAMISAEDAGDRMFNSRLVLRQCLPIAEWLHDPAPQRKHLNRQHPKARVASNRVHFTEQDQQLPSHRRVSLIREVVKRHRQIVRRSKQRTRFAFGTIATPRKRRG